MSDSKKPVNRIPAAEAGRWQAWALPDVADAKQRISSNEQQVREQLDGRRQGERIEDVSVDQLESFSGLTAEQLHHIVQQAEKEGFDKGYQDGLQQGRDEGHKAGQQQGLNEMRSQLMADQKRFRDLAQALLTPVEEQDQHLETLLLSMVERLTKAVVRRELKTGREDMQTLIRQAVNALPTGATRLHIFLNPEDLERLNYYTREQNDWQFVADEQMAPGGVRVETGDSVVDDSVERALEDAIERFLHQHDSDEHTTDEALFDNADTIPVTGGEPQENEQ